MQDNFIPVQKESILAVLDVPRGKKSFMTTGCRLAISDVQQALRLPPFPYRQFCGPDCWLAGGSILRWLCSARRKEEAIRGDFDFFFSSLPALNFTARAMLHQGFQVEGYRALSRTVGEYLRPTRDAGKDSEIWDAGGGLAPLTAERIARLRLAYLKLRSPAGEEIQLVASCYNTPMDTIRRFDFSICQLLADDQYLFFGPWTWSDLLQNRLRACHISRPDASFQRMFRYSRRGFLPSPTTALRVLAAVLVQVALVPKLLVRPLPAGQVDLFR